MSIKFKLAKRDGLTRRVTFSSQPSWNALSARIHTLFAIPIDKVAVAYIDSENDEVTLSSEEELRDFYQATPGPPGAVIKFIVQDLSRNEKALPDTPRSTAFRNTFGNIDNEGLPFDIDIEDDWQRLPSLGGVFVAPLARSESPHAFIRVVESDATSASTNDDSDDESDNHSTTDFGHVTSAFDKGKGKAVDPSPAPSVVGDDLVSIHEGSILFEKSTPPTPLPDSPTTVTGAVEPEVATGQPQPEAAKAANEDDASDPPLPTIDPHQPSLTHDVATLLTTLTNVVSAHPELSEGLRNIIQNATNGIYWNSQRAAMSQAAGEFVQTTGDAARRAEQEAGQRVAEAVGGMFRTFTQVLGANTTHADPAAAAASAEDPGQPWRTSTPTAEQVNPSSFWYGPHPTGAGPRTRGRGGRRGSWGGPHHGPFPPRPHFLDPFGTAPAGAPPLPHGVPRGPWPFGPWGPPHAGPPPPPGPPPPGFSAPPAPPPADGEHPKATPQELRAQVEAAKLLYKVEKERYRAEREERRRAREQKHASVPPANPQPLVDTSTPEKPAEPASPPVLVSAGNPKVGYPPLEMYSVPHRSKTFHGRPTRRHGHEDAQESPNERTIHRITKRLAAMGITEKAHPSLPTKIKEQVPKGAVTDEAENNIVSTLVEELLYMSPKPAASGSGLRDTELPGAWP